MTATRPAPELVLPGRGVLLRALTPEDLPALHAAIGHPEVFAGGWGGGPAAYRADYAGWARHIGGYLRWGVGNVYAVCLPRDSGQEVVGTTTLADFNLEHGSAHIGWTAYAPRLWGTPLNTDVKLTLLGAAFEHGFERVQLQADVLNARSRRAIEAIGAVPEGVLRHTQRRADGSWRDTAVYSIVSHEWPQVRQALRARLDRKAASRTA